MPSHERGDSTPPLERMWGHRPLAPPGTPVELVQAELAWLGRRAVRELALCRAGGVAA
eukprot:CAMPEP_0195627342 /NCGR_PEP_ID=MMETSP0815-20121206/18865_1 /TAXON_ID=97485 /ORGANISM="Prymnesium parvum, Strain Texoma1" /LENGTH=57 /DNA_ID=CAMNT_0040768539 /DNA_START=126 /DNA_END=299 /DNA_ORIENTATION=+